ncbi:MAG: hypothetical protein KatS3mg081_1899 [Gemmatimonadales bacterium]|nr:hypothetical protein HRbin33_01326 [bacterium HR33]GIW52544.1 MAG: hypothetical protein KatS3mg081_1899 [Gemmatimonadales bacterium]
MNPTTFNDPNQPGPPDEQDRLLDLRLAALPRFDPSPGFADRVMARIRIPHPAPARVPWYYRPRAVPAGIQRLAAALAVMAATSSSLLTLWIASNFQSLAESARSYATALAASALDELLRQFARWSSFLGEAAAAVASSTGWPAAAAILAGCVAAIPLSMLGLYLLSRSPASAGRTHALR